MKNHFRRMLAVLAAVLLTLGPVAPLAYATQVDTTGMPSVNVYYQVDESASQMTAALPTTDAAGRAYWAVLPAEAFAWPITVEILPTDPTYSYGPENGTVLSSGDAMDFNSASTQIIAYIDGQPQETFNLYVSSSELPAAEVSPVEVPVYYVNAENPDEILYSTSVTCYYNADNPIVVDGGAIAGYAPEGTEQYYVTVDENGQANPSSVTFTLRRQVVQGSIAIHYADANGNPMGESENRTLDPGPYQITPSIGMPEGYTLEPAYFDVMVDEQGNASPASMTFVYTPIQSVTGYVNVLYVDTTGATVAEGEWQEFEAGPAQITPSIATPEGYTLLEPSYYDVTIDEQGNANPASVTFTYQPPEKPVVKGYVTVSYVDSTGATLAGPEQRELDPGPAQITPSIATPEGYTLLEPSYYDVTIDEQGNANPASVTFTYQPPEKPAVKGYVTVEYTDIGGMELLSPERVELDPGPHTIVPTASIPSGYTLSPECPSSYEVVVDEQGNASPDTVTFEYKETEAPVTQGSVTIYHVDSTGAALAEPQAQPLDVGGHTVSPTIATPEGYSLLEPVAYQVAVDEQGNTSPAEVTFTYQKQETPPAEPTLTPINRYGLTNVGGAIFRKAPSKDSGKAASGVSSNTAVWVYGSLEQSDGLWYSINYNGKDCYASGAIINLLNEGEVVPGALTVHYVDTNGATVAASHQLPLDPGAHTVTPTAAIPEGYTLLEPVSYDVVADNAGAASPASVTFTYQAPVAPKGTVTIHYVDTNGAVIADAQTVQFDANTSNTVTPTATIPEGYTLMGDGAVNVAVDANGAASPASVTFTYQVPPAPKGTVTIHYVDTNGAVIADAQTVQFDANTSNTVTPTATIPEGYTLLEPASYTVAVDANGAANPASVTFTYQAPPAPKGTVTVNYVDTNGTAIVIAQTVQFDANTSNTVTPTATIPEGYTLVGDGVVNVTVDANGAASPASVTFTYQAPVVPKASVTVYYVDTNGSVIASPQTYEYAANTANTITPAASIPEGYVLVSNGTVNVTVDGNGAANPTSVTFTYQAPSAIKATVMVYYTDTVGATIAAPETRVLEVGTHILTPTADIPQGYTITGAGNFSVAVSTAGVATPASVTFTYLKQSAEEYFGFALTTTQTALRSATSSADSAVIRMLETGTLLYINGQRTVDNVLWDGAITYIGEKQYGFVTDAAVQHISDVEAQVIINANQNNKQPGYYYTVGDGVPMRVVASVYANSATYLSYKTVVYVSSFTANEGYGWCVSTYGKYTGYIREDQLQRMTDAEVQAYLAQNTAAPSNTVTPAPYDPYAASSYGYITKNSVNFRQTPSGTRVKTLNQYAFALILGSREVDGVTWYNINQSGTTGWVHGDFFKVLNLTELSSFLNSSEYLTGLSNSGSSSSSGSSSGSSSASGSSGSATQGAISSVEDWNVGVWQSSGTGVNVSYAPFDPYATPSATITAEATPTPAPTETFVIGTMIPITYEDQSKETQTDSSWVGFAIGAVVLLGGAGGIYAYALNQNKKRRAAARSAAASRAAATRGTGAATGAAAGTTASPYARRAVAAPPYAAGTQRKDEPSGAANGTSNPYARATQNPYAGQGGAANPYAQSTANPYARPAGAQAPQNPYARSVSTVADKSAETAAKPNPYAQPANPYAKPSSADGVRNASGTENPTSTAGDTPSSAPTHRRAGRTARYQGDADKRE